MLFYRMIKKARDGSLKEKRPAFEFVRQDGLVDGVRVSKMLKKSPGDDYASFKTRDFQLQEIIESGATDMLTYTAPISIDKLSALDVSGAAASGLASTQSKVDEMEAAEASSSSVQDSTVE